MDTSLSTSIFFGFVFTFYALLVRSQPQNNPAQRRPPPQYFVPPRSTSPSAPPPFVLPPPPSPHHYLSSRPPPGPSHLSPLAPTPSPRKSHGKAAGGARNAYRGGRRHHPPPPPPQKLHSHKMNAGKKIGLLFVGIAVILQIGVVGFLVFKRRQLLKIKDRYETCSS